MRTVLSWSFRALALGCLYAAIFHAASFFNGSLEPRMPAWEHALFVPINLLLIVGCLWRPRWFVIVFGLFTVQQLISHGRLGLIAWQQGVFDWRSLVVVVAMPLALLAFIYDARLRAADAAAR